MPTHTLRKSAIAGLLSAVMLYVPVLPPDLAAQGVPRQASTTQDDQTDLSITVYNSDLALVRDVREIDLPSGTSQLKFADIAASVNPATVHFRSLDNPGRLNVLEQDYEYDLLDPQKLLGNTSGAS